MNTVDVQQYYKDINSTFIIICLILILKKIKTNIDYKQL